MINNLNEIKNPKYKKTIIIKKIKKTKKLEKKSFLLKFSKIKRHLFLNSFF
jgi:hypothetical protein